MKKIINLISSISIISFSLNFPVYAKSGIAAQNSYVKDGKYGYSLITSEHKKTEKFEKNNWIRSRERKIPCGNPNVVGIQSTSSSTLIASTPHPIPNFDSCSVPIKIKLV